MVVCQWIYGNFALLIFAFVFAQSDFLEDWF